MGFTNVKELYNLFANQFRNFLNTNKKTTTAQHSTAHTDISSKVITKFTLNEIRQSVLQPLSDTWAEADLWNVERAGPYKTTNTCTISELQLIKKQVCIDYLQNKKIKTYKSIKRLKLVKWVKVNMQFIEVSTNGLAWLIWEEEKQRTSCRQQTCFCSQICNKAKSDQWWEEAIDQINAESINTAWTSV